MKENWTRGKGYIYTKDDENYTKRKLEALAEEYADYGNYNNDVYSALARNDQAIYCEKCHSYTFISTMVAEEIHANYGNYENMKVNKDGVAIGKDKEIPKELCAHCGEFHPLNSMSGPSRFELGWGMMIPEKVKALEWFYNEHSEDGILYRYEVRNERRAFYHNPRRFHCLMRYKRGDNGGWYEDEYSAKLIFLGYNWNQANYIVSSHILSLLDMGTITNAEFDIQDRKFTTLRKGGELYNEDGRINSMDFPKEE